jgi:hypothetical protein
MTTGMQFTEMVEKGKKWLVILEAREPKNPGWWYAPPLRCFPPQADLRRKA